MGYCLLNKRDILLWGFYQKHPNPFKIKYQTFVYRVRNQNMNMKDAMEKRTADQSAVVLISEI